MIQKYSFSVFQLITKFFKCRNIISFAGYLSIDDLINMYYLIHNRTLLKNGYANTSQNEIPFCIRFRIYDSRLDCLLFVRKVYK